MSATFDMHLEHTAVWLMRSVASFAPSSRICVAACTSRDCLGVTREGKWAWSPWLVPTVALAAMLGFWTVARLTGFWETDVTAEAFRWAYRALGIG